MQTASRSRTKEREVKKKLPDLNPILAPDLVCQGCGSVLKAKFPKAGIQKVNAVYYECRNEASGCSYRITSNDMIHAEMKALRDDGSEVQLEEV